jgi:lysozyme
MTVIDWRRVQSRLATLNYYTGEIDGIAGPLTREALKRLQMANGLEPDGIYGGETERVLFAKPSQLAPLKTNKAGVALIKSYEQCRLKAYRDSAGVWTVGWGLTTAAGLIDVRSATTLTQQEADNYFVLALIKFEQEVAAVLKRTPTDNQFSAMVSLAYNIGGTAFRTSSVCRFFNDGKSQQAADSFRLWNKSGGKVSAGLISRRESERALFLNGAVEQPVEAPQPPPVSEAPELPPMPEISSRSFALSQSGTGGRDSKPTAVMCWPCASANPTPASTAGPRYWNTAFPSTPPPVPPISIAQSSSTVKHERTMHMKFANLNALQTYLTVAIGAIVFAMLGLGCTQTVTGVLDCSQSAWINPTVAGWLIAVIAAIKTLVLPFLQPGGWFRNMFEARRQSRPRERLAPFILATLSRNAFGYPAALSPSSIIMARRCVE